MPERFAFYIVKRRYINTLPFLFYRASYAQRGLPTGRPSVRPSVRPAVRFLRLDALGGFIDFISVERVKVLERQHHLTRVECRVTLAAPTRTSCQ